MKRSIIVFGVMACLGTGCNDDKENKKEEQPAQQTVEKPVDKLIDSVKCEGRNMGRFKQYTLNDVGIMADHYRDLVYDDYHYAIRQVELNPIILNSLLCDITTIKLVSAAEDKKISMVLEYDKGKAESYYDMEQVFGVNILCPPPDNCGIPLMDKKLLKKEPGDTLKFNCTPYDMSKFATINIDVVKKMADNYVDAIKEDRRNVIQQIKFLDTKLLRDVLCNVDGFKMIAAASDDKKKISMILEYGRGGTTMFYDLQEVFGVSILCPPPDNCGLPFLGPAKNDKSKRPKQK